MSDNLPKELKLFFKIIDAKRKANGKPFGINEMMHRNSLFSQTVQAYEEIKNRNHEESKFAPASRKEERKEINKKSNDYQVNINPPPHKPQRRSSTLKRGRKNLVLQNNQEAVIDTRRNNAWQSDNLMLMNMGEENKVEELQSERQEDESKILSIVNREIEQMRREQDFRNESQDIQDIGVRLLDTPNYEENRQQRTGQAQQQNRDSLIFNFENEANRLL